MDIIDAHMHFSTLYGFNMTAKAAGHVNSAEHIASVYKDCGVIKAVAMGSGEGGNGGYCAPATVDLAGDPAREKQPGFLFYTCGVRAAKLNKSTMRETLEAFEERFSDPRCVGIKLYPGYDWYYPHDSRFWPLIELAGEFGLPVVIHTGDTASSGALVKYAHPLAVDEVAVRFPKVRFVMAHFGNPWLPEATEVIKKNPNVYADISGLAEGNIDAGKLYDTHRDYFEYLGMWMGYLGDYSRLIFGTDWPLVNVPQYIELMRMVVPENAQNDVFCGTAMRVFERLKGA